MPKTFKTAKIAYAMERDGDDAVLTLYGDIVETRPVDFWTGEPVSGEYIVLDEFLEDLAQVQDAKRITMRINSLGGDVADGVKQNRCYNGTEPSSELLLTA